ncbi:hypothetical protein E2C01_047004 [Portunus trituberculatus]|uniref:Uncharacterized protein n=1 Tax=Portunus trituberculatus TaxID=210409 RepID=A0A5B7G6A1_PORTR|nr:hypothetical protein [Portunus trituberculatus]
MVSRRPCQITDTEHRDGTRAAELRALTGGTARRGHRTGTPAYTSPQHCNDPPVRTLLARAALTATLRHTCGDHHHTSPQRRAQARPMAKPGRGEHRNTDRDNPRAARRSLRCFLHHGWGHTAHCSLPPFAPAPTVHLHEATATPPRRAACQPASPLSRPAHAAHRPRHMSSLHCKCVKLQEACVRQGEHTAGQVGGRGRVTVASPEGCIYGTALSTGAP